MTFINIFTITTTGLSVVIYALLIFLILRKNYKSCLNRSLALYLFFINIAQIGGSIIMLIPDPGFSLSLYRFCLLFFVFIPSAFYIFVQQLLKKRIPKRTIFGIILFCILWIILCILAPGFTVKNVIWSESAQFYLLVLNFPAGLLLVAPILLLFFAGAGFELLMAYLRSKSTIERNRLKYLFLGILVLPIGFVAILIPPLSPYPIDMIMMTVSGILFAYTILRYKLLDITLAIRKGLLYSILTAVVTSIYLLFSLALQFIFQKPETPISFPAIFSTAIFIAIIFQPLQIGTQSFIDRVFSRRKYEPQKLVAELSQIFSEILDLNLLTKVFIKTLCTTIQIEKAALFLVDEETNKLEICEVRNISPKIRELTITRDPPLIKLLSESDEVQSRYELQENNIGLEGLGNFDLELFVPLRTQEKLRGVLALGPKLSKELYSLEEFNLLETIGHNAALALHNASLFAQLEKEKERVEDARATLEIRVQARTKELRELAESLDEQVKEKTKELQEKIEKLEKFQKVTISRELKMIELKKAIETLKKD